MPRMVGVLPWLSPVAVVSPIVHEGVSLRNDHLKVTPLTLNNNRFSGNAGNTVAVGDYLEWPEPLLRFDIEVISRKMVGSYRRKGFGRLGEMSEHLEVAMGVEP